MKTIIRKFVRKLLTFESLFDIMLLEQVFRTNVFAFINCKGELIMRKTYYGDYSYMNRVEDSKAARAKAARTRQLRRRKMLLLIGVIITIALCTIFSVKAFAKTDSTKGEFGMKQYKSIMIYCGDTVESIAQANFSFPYSSSDKLAEEIRSINHLGTDEKLIAGNYIVIPFYSL